MVAPGLQWEQVQVSNRAASRLFESRGR